MEEAHTQIIQSNLNRLIQDTIISAAFLAFFIEAGVLSEGDIQSITEHNNNHARSFQFYSIIKTRSEGFCILQHALRETNQSGVLERLHQEGTTRFIASWELINTSVAIVYNREDVLASLSANVEIFRGFFGNRVMVAVLRAPTDSSRTTAARREVRLLGIAGNHENIIQCYVFSQLKNYSLFVLECCEESLETSIAKKHYPINPIDILKQITSGIRFLHKKNIIHGCIKPTNILFAQCGDIYRAKISDFKMAVKLPDDKSKYSQETCSIETAGWIIPEVRNGGKMSFDADIFSLGCVFCCVLTDGIHPFGEDIDERPINIKTNTVDERAFNFPVPHKQLVSKVKCMISPQSSQRPNIFEVEEQHFSTNKNETFISQDLKGKNCMTWLLPMLFVILSVLAYWLHFEILKYLNSTDVDTIDMPFSNNEEFEDDYDAVYTSLDAVAGFLDFEICSPDFVRDESETSYLLNRLLKDRLFGQHLVRYTLTANIYNYQRLINPVYPLILGLLGPPGTGKIFTAEMIAKAMYKHGDRSKFVKFFRGDDINPEPDSVLAYKEFVVKTVTDTVAACPKSLFVFERVESLPAGILDDLLLYIVNPQIAQNQPNLHKAVIILTGNTGSELINSTVLQHYKDGKPRGQLKLDDFQNTLSNLTKNATGGWYQSRLIQHMSPNQIIPYLPMNHHHVADCLRRLFKRHPHVILTENGLVQMARKRVYWPNDMPVFSTNGCRSVSNQVDEISAKEKYKKEEAEKVIKHNKRLRWFGKWRKRF